jgi:hypothetical protein
MSDIDRGPPPERDEVIERREVVERRTPADRAPVRETVREPVREPARGPGVTPIVLVLLLLVVIGLVYFIFARGQPAQPLDNVQIEVPTVEAPVVSEERRIEIQTPAPSQPSQPDGQ